MTWKSRRPRFCSVGTLIGMAFGFTLLLLSGCEKGQGQQAPSAPTVEVMEVIQKDVPVYSEWIGSTDGSVNATIRAQVQGYLIKQLYREGDLVRKGQILFEIDPRPFQAALDQTKAEWDQAKASMDRAKASLDQAKADVARMEAQYATAKANLRRIKDLVEQDLMSQKDLDEAVGTEQSAGASVSAAQAAANAAQASISAVQASVSAAQAALERTRLNLGFTKIMSPVDGIAGIAKAQIGNLVGPGSVEELTTVSNVNPIKVYIPMSEQEYMRDGQNGGARTQQVLELILADGSVHPHKGTFAFADREVNVRTGTIKVAALFPNPGNLLRPGQFARVRAQTRIKKGALLAAQRAVMELQGSYQVAVVGSDNKVDIRPVKVAERVDTLWVIEEGLKPGERVVVEGVQKARQGITVNPRPFGAEGGVKPEIKPQTKPEAPAKPEPEEKTAAPAKTEKR
jgi:membrane fusion protein, multidrug efflux system